MPRSKFKITIAGRVAESPEELDYLTSSETTSWAGVPLEVQGLGANINRGSCQVLTPVLALLTKGSPRAAWRGEGVYHREAWEPGTLILMNRDYHLQESKFDCAHEMITIQLPDTLAEKWVQVSKSLALPKFVTSTDSLLSALLSAMREEVLAGCPSGQLFAQSLSQACLQRIWTRYGVDGPLPVPAAGGLSRAKLARLAEYIWANSAREVTLEELAQLVDLSASHLCRSFKQATGLSPYKYVMTVRIKKAKILLHQSELSIAEISLNCGFSSQSHFSSAFRQEMGSSPRQFRIQH